MNKERLNERHMCSNCKEMVNYGYLTEGKYICDDCLLINKKICE